MHGFQKRFPAGGEYGELGVRAWNESTGTVTGQRSPIQGGFSVADPRHYGPDKHSNEFRIVPWSREACAVTGAPGITRRCTPGFGVSGVAAIGTGGTGAAAAGRAAPGGATAAEFL